MGNTDTEPPQPNCLHTAPGTASLTRVGEDTFVVVEGRELTFEQLQRLPDDPDALGKWVVDAVDDDLDPSASAEILDDNVAGRFGQPARGRPGAAWCSCCRFPALADMPNVRSIGSIRDELGRAGIGILMDTAGIVVAGGGQYKAGNLTRKLIIDPDTSHVLASQTSVGETSVPFSGTLILEVGWTDEEPARAGAALSRSAPRDESLLWLTSGNDLALDNLREEAQVSDSVHTVPLGAI